LPHHFPEEELAVEGGEWRGDLWEGWIFLSGGFVEGGPEGGIVEVGVEAGEPGGVHREFATFETLPEAVGGAAGDAVVYPAWGDVEGKLIVEDCLEGGDNLGAD